MVFKNPDKLTPEEFELTVKRWFEAAAGDWESFDSQHRELVGGMDGEYEIDVTIRFRAFKGARFLVLAECKKLKNPVKREVVQILYDRLRSVGAHKGFIFATTSFQRGAIEYAGNHGIALVQVANGSTAYIQASGARERLRIPPDAPPYVGWHWFMGPDGHESFEIMNEQESYHLREILGVTGAA